MVCENCFFFVVLSPPLYLIIVITRSLSRSPSAVCSYRCSTQPRGSPKSPSLTCFLFWLRDSLFFFFLLLLLLFLLRPCETTELIELVISENLINALTRRDGHIPSLFVTIHHSGPVREREGDRSHFHIYISSGRRWNPIGFECILRYFCIFFFFSFWELFFFWLFYQSIGTNRCVECWR